MAETKINAENQSADWKSSLAVWLATGAWVGLVPWAPGTLGAVWGIALAWALGLWPWWAQVGLLTGLFLLGVPICQTAAVQLGKKDPGQVVWDEIVTVPITFFLIPLANPWVVAAGFGLHRLFDITKPPPARQLEKLPGGWGIMADDLAAGIYSHLVLRLLLWWGWLTTS